MLNVSTATVKRSKTVLEKGVPELVDMQRSGEISAKAAQVVARLPEAEQRKAISGGVAGVKAASQKHPDPEPLVMPKQGRIPRWIPDDAERLWLLAKTDLDKILPSDKSRERILKEVVKYAQNRIDTNK
jgi:hypothetical protein